MAPVNWNAYRLGLLDSPGLKQQKIEAFVNKMIERILFEESMGN